MRKSSAARARKLSTSKRVLNACVESLEIRRLLATITVTSTGDTITPNDGAVTLREAITAINAGNDLADPNITAQNPTATNAFGTKDTIDFNISGGGVHTIQPTSQLPTILNPVTIDGYSQSGASAATANTLATIEIELDGENAGTTSVGLDVEAANVTIDGLAVNRFTSDGIVLDGSRSSNDVVWGNYLGISAESNTGAGSNPNVGNGGSGVLIESGASFETVGGTSAADRNILSGNSFYGVDITLGSGGSSDGNQDDVVEGNYIGTDATGTIAIGNDADGVLVEDASQVTIGGTIAGSRNLISGNNLAGVDIAGADNSTVQGNYIGTDVTGAKAIANGGDGVRVFDTSLDTTIGGTVAGARNLISGNSLNGIEAKTVDAIGIQGNYIGTDVTGTKAIANFFDGVAFDTGGGNSTIGGPDAGAGNLISGNGANGVDLIQGVDSVRVYGNYIGTDSTGLAALGNKGNGVQIQQGALDTSVGLSDPAYRNIISGNSSNGVEIDGTDTGPNTIDNTIEGNYIGTDVTGNNALGDGSAGVYIDRGAEKNEIGGTDPGARNVISGIAGAGVYISGITKDFSGGSPGSILTNSNTVEGNYIGTNAACTGGVVYPESSGGESFPYNGVGVYLDEGAHDNTIGGLTAASRNIIAANKASGVVIDSGATNKVEGNYIGIDASGSEALGNAVYGVAIVGDFSGNVIGGTGSGAGNVISANGDDGVFIGASGMVVQGNTIGLFADRVTAAGNGQSGIQIEGICQDNTIGGTTSAAGNIIADNMAIGVEVSSANGVGESPIDNSIQRNSIYNNGGLGIDLDNFDVDTRQGGVSPNDLGDADLGPNDNQNFPVIASANSTATSVTVNGAFNSTANTIFTLDFYASDNVDPTGFGEGKQWIGAIAVLTDANGNAVFSGTFNAVVGNNKYISSTATNVSTAPYGDTSEFSQTVEATGTTPSNPTPPTPPTISIGDVSMNEGNSGTTAFVFTVTRAGDLSGASSVAVGTADGTATIADSDYLANAAVLNFASGDATKTFTVTVKGDTKVESDETFQVNLTGATGATVSTPTATGTIKNDDTAPPPPPSNKVSIITDPCDSSKKAVEIDGTSGNDTITVTKSGSSQGKVVVKINNVNKGTFSFTGSIIVRAGSGNDNVSIDSAITRETFIFGEAGNDTLSGGGGSDVIVGGDGNDKISGNNGRDLLFGSNGSDSLSGGNDDDILDGGTTADDTSISSLCKLQDEWTRTDKSYTFRVQHITQGGGLNGSVKLNASTSFSSTTLKDTLTGGSGSDLFFAAVPGDVITDKVSGETVVDIG